MTGPRRFMFLDEDLSTPPDPAGLPDKLAIVTNDGAMWLLDGGVWKPFPVVFPTGTVLPDPTGMIDGAVFVLDNGDTTHTLYHLQGGAWSLVTQPGGGGGGSGPFSDNFNRSDRPLSGDNGWFAAMGTNSVGDLHIVGNQVLVPDTTLGQTSGWDPMLHPRNDGAAGVADVTVTHNYGPHGSQGSITGLIVVCSDVNHANAIGVEFDGTTYLYIYRHLAGDSDESPTTVTSVGAGWAGWAAGPMVIRCVYDEGTKLLTLYQNGTEVATCDMGGDAVAGAGNFDYLDGDLPALSTMPYMGIAEPYGAGYSIYDNVVCA